jgi:hypothetical protein
VHILATSREPLTADGERIQQVQPLDLPAQARASRRPTRCAFGAIELFVDRATAALDTYVFQDADVDPWSTSAAGWTASARDRAGGRMHALARRARHPGRAREQLHPAQARPAHGVPAPPDDVGRDRLELRAPVAARAHRPRADLDVLRQLHARVRWCRRKRPLNDACRRLRRSDELAAKSLVSVDVSGDPTYFRLLETTRGYASNRLAE